MVTLYSGSVLVSAFLEKVTLPMKSELKNRLEGVIPVVKVRVVQFLFWKKKKKATLLPSALPTVFFL